MSIVIDEQRKRREFLYYVYITALHYNTQPAGSIDRADAGLIYQDMDRNWEMQGNRSFAPILRYHLAKGNISLIDANAEPPGNGLSLIDWDHPENIFANWIYITATGKEAVENDHDLLNHVFEDGLIVDWSRINTIEQRTGSDLDKPEAAPQQSGSINFGSINSAGDVNINLSHVAGRDQITTTTSTAITHQTSPAAQGEKSQTAINLVELSQLIRKHYSLGELKSLCFELQVEYDDLAGETLTNKVQSLVEYLERRGRVPHLLTLVKQQRPHTPWPDTPSN